MTEKKPMHEIIKYIEERTRNLNRVSQKLKDSFNLLANKLLVFEKMPTIEPVYSKQQFNRSKEYYPVFYRLAYNHEGLWILDDMGEDYPKCQRQNEIAFSDLSNSEQVKVIKYLPTFLNHINNVLANREENNEEALKNIEKIIESIESAKFFEGEES